VSVGFNVLSSFPAVRSAGSPLGGLK
jgi:hypothetical protein